MFLFPKPLILVALGRQRYIKFYVNQTQKQGKLK